MRDQSFAQRIFYDVTILNQGKTVRRRLKPNTIGRDYTKYAEKNCMALDKKTEKFEKMQARKEGGKVVCSLKIKLGSEAGKKKQRYLIKKST